MKEKIRLLFRRLILWACPEIVLPREIPEEKAASAPAVSGAHAHSIRERTGVPGAHVWIVAFLLFSGVAYGQAGGSQSPGPKTGSGAPAGGCGTQDLYIDTVGGNLYDCKAGLWNLVTGGGGGGAFINGLGTGFQDVTEIAAPANPGAGNDRLYLNSSTHLLTCITSSGANCAPSGGGSGTVTSFSAGTLSPLFTTSVATPTVTPALTFTLSTAAANTIFGNCTVGVAAPNYCAITAAMVPTLNQNTTGTAAAWTTARNLAGNSVDGSANVAFANKFIVQGTTDAGLSAAQFMGALGTGILKNTTTTGILSIAVAGDFPTLNQSTTGSAATLTTARLLAGNSFNGSADVPFPNKFIVQGTVDAGLTGAQFLGALGTGLLKNTTTTGVLSLGASADVISLWTGTCNAGTFLRADGSCQAAGGGSGTLTATGLSLPVNQIVLGNTYPDTKPLGSLGTTTTVLHGNAAGPPSFGAVALATDVSGQLPIGNVGSAGLSGTAPITIGATGAIGCATCVTSSGGGAETATAPVTVSAAGLIACATCVTSSGGGAETATAPVTVSAAGLIACATCAVGPGASTTTDLATFNGAGGLLLQDSGIASANVVTTNTTQTVAGIKHLTGADTASSLDGIIMVDGTTYTTLAAAVTACVSPCWIVDNVPETFAADPFAAATGKIISASFGAGTWTISSGGTYGMQVPSNVSVMCSSPATIFKVGNATNYTHDIVVGGFGTSTTNNAQIDNCTIDGNAANNTGGVTTSVILVAGGFAGGGNNRITRNTFLAEPAGAGIMVSDVLNVATYYPSVGDEIAFNTFPVSNGCSSECIAVIGHSATGGEFFNTRIHNNRIYQSLGFGIEMRVANGVITSENQVDGLICCGGLSTVSTTNVANSVVTFTVGTTTGLVKGSQLKINRVTYTVSSVTDATHLVLTTNAGTQTAVAAYGGSLELIHHDTAAYGLTIGNILRNSSDNCLSFIGMTGGQSVTGVNIVGNSLANCGGVAINGDATAGAALLIGNNVSGNTCDGAGQGGAAEAGQFDSCIRFAGPLAQANTIQGNWLGDSAASPTTQYGIALDGSIGANNVIGFNQYYNLVAGPFRGGGALASQILPNAVALMANQSGGGTINYALIQGDSGNGVTIADNGGRLINLNGSTVLTGYLSANEMAAPSGSAAHDLCYGDSTVHALLCSYNNGTYGLVPLLNNGVTFTGVAPASVATTPGTAAQPLLNWVGQAGGATTNASGTGGAGASGTLAAGAGGAASGATASTGGAGGSWNFTAGAGGAGAGTGVNSNGGGFIFTPGAAGTGGSGTAGKAGVLAVSGSTAGFNYFTQGAANTTLNTNIPANSIIMQAPAAVTAYALTLAGAAATGLPHYANAANVITETISAVNLASADVTGILPQANGGTGTSAPKQQIITADWTCGTGGVNTTCVAAQTISTLSFTLPLVAATWSVDCNLIVGQATAVTANSWNIQTATNGATNLAAGYTMFTAATAAANGALTGVASTTTTQVIAPTWTLGAIGTKMNVHLWATIEGASASGTVVNIQLVAPTVADLVTVYRGSQCRVF
jgi:hypothetical protein